MKKIFGFASMLVAFCAASVFTSCSDDDDDEEYLALEGITAVANTDGTITFTGQVVSETRLKSLKLTAEDGTEYDLLAEKNVKEKDENGTKRFITTLAETNVPVAIYKLSANQKKEGKGSITIGAAYSITAGAGAKSTLGSYVSLKNLSVCTKDEVSADNCAEIEVVCNDEANFIKSTNAKNAGSFAYPKTEIYNTSSVKVDFATAGTIISKDGVIATFSIEKDSNTDNATIKGVRIVSTNNISLDLSALDAE